MVEEDQPEREPAEQIEPQIASGGDHGGMHLGDLSHDDEYALILEWFVPRWNWKRTPSESRHRDGCKPPAYDIHWSGSNSGDVAPRWNLHDEAPASGLKARR